MRFFRWPNDTSLPVIEIRTISYDPEYKKKKQPDVLAKTIFCRNLPANMCHSDLYKEFTKLAKENEIKSVQVALDPQKRKSRKYGFASFNTKEVA